MENELVYFKLKCRRFIEMVRRAAEIRLQSEGKKANGVDASQAMDVDTNGVEAGAWDSMDTEEGPEQVEELQDLERDVIEYGQQLQAEYRSDLRREVQKTLEDIWSLMAYPNPLREPKVAHLMDNKERSTVAEMVNSMILRKWYPDWLPLSREVVTNMHGSLPRKVVECGPDEALRRHEQSRARAEGGRAWGVLFHEGHNRLDPKVGGAVSFLVGGCQAGCPLFTGSVHPSSLVFSGVSCMGSLGSVFR